MTINGNRDNQSPVNSRSPEHPPFLYGTAWKEEKTRSLTFLAIRLGFRGIDTANQRKHYFEEAVGEGIADAIGDGLVTREDLFLQTKFTHQSGQDERLPYNAKASIGDQVRQSFASSQVHLGVDFIDSYVLHGPTIRKGLGAADLDAWKAMEAIQAEGKVGSLGISNISLEQLRTLHKVAKIKPRFVQIRCYAARCWERDIREFCSVNGIVFQGFSLLTANRQVLNHEDMKEMARLHRKTTAQIVLRYALEVGILPLTGTKSGIHMAEDLDIFGFQLTVANVKAIETMGSEEKPQPFRTSIKRPGD
jgi:diketogulonate reductase-like aldo/keto reductase